MCELKFDFQVYYSLDQLITFNKYLDRDELFTLWIINMQSRTNSKMELTTAWTSEIRKYCCKAYMVTYQLNDWIKAGVRLGEGSFFQIDQIVTSILASSK